MKAVFTKNLSAPGKKLLGLISLGLVVGFSTTAFAKKGKARVYVDSVASTTYEEGRKLLGGDEIETYHFYKGRFFGGNIRDKSLERTEFQSIVETLAKDMRHRNYYPAPDRESGDLFIVVHYGTTSIDPDWNDLMGVTDFGSSDDGSADGDTGESFDSGAQDYQDFNRLNSNQGRESAAKLTGFDRALRKRSLSTTDEYTLRAELEDERYFIIMMAYDWQKLRTEGKFELQWSTRFSLNSIGTNFEDAYYALSRAAAPYFGTNLNDLTKERTFFGEGDVTTGELEVVETLEEGESSP